VTEVKTEVKTAEILKLPVTAGLVEPEQEPLAYQLHLREAEDPVFFFDHRELPQLLVALYEATGPKRPKGLGWFETMTGAWDARSVRGINRYFNDEGDEAGDEDDEGEPLDYMTPETLEALQHLTLGKP